METDSIKLTVMETAGQLVMPRLDFNTKGYFRQAARLVEKFQISGFIIFNGELEQVRKTTANLQAISNNPLFFGIDAERGLGQIVEGGTRFPFLMSQGASDNPELVELQARNTAREMKYCGLNLLFAPVLDINTNHSNPIVNVRAFGDNAEYVTRLGTIFSSIVKSEGVFACGKHFPGHGSTNVDSHAELPVLKKNIEDLMNFDLKPFRKAIDSGIDFIMVGHLATERIEEANVPATISETLVREILREKLGFSGVVITDSFRMDALKKIGSEEEVAVKSIKAGCDIVLDPYESDRLITKLADKLLKDEMFFSRTKKSVARLFELKKKIQSASEKLPDKKISFELVNRIARESVCLVKGKTLGRVKVDINIFDVTKSISDIYVHFLDSLKQNGIEINSVNNVSNDYDFGKSYEFDIVNVVITTVSAWTEYSVLTDFYHKVLTHISKLDRNKILVSFGSPYLIADFLDYNTVISSFEIIEPCQKAAAELLTGKLISNAKLPIKF